MRHLGDSSAGPPTGRPADPAAARQAGAGQGVGGPPPGARPSGSGPAGDQAAGRGGDRSVFVPGYRDGRQGRAPTHHAATPGTPGVPWHGSSADSAIGKGPVRGFPPTPGQPPPLYPPGQFSAWNRRAQSRRDAQGGARSGAGQGADHGRFAGDQRDRPGHHRQGSYAQDDSYSSDDSYSHDGSGGDDRQHYQPGYPALAVSDPAADVTSTQTWETVGDAMDSHAAGTWTDPRGITGQPSQHPAADPPGMYPPGARQAAAGPRMTGTRTTGPGTGTAGPGTAGPENTRTPGSRSRRPGGTGRGAGRGGGRKRRGPSSAILAVCAVGGLALAAVVFLLFTARHQGGVTADQPTPSATPSSSSASPRPSATPTLGPFGHIATRAADPLPLTITQLYPHSFTAGSARFVRTISKLQKSCTSAIVGSALQAAVRSAKCTQAVRASYLSASRKVMGTIGVLNLSTSKTAAHAGHAAGASDFIERLRAGKGATHDLGKGTGIEEAETKGHYLILIWAQLTSTHKPKTAAQRAKLDDFIRDLFDKTANVSLSSRMVDGTP